MSGMSAEERARLRALWERWEIDPRADRTQHLATAVPALLDEVDRLTEELVASERQAIGYRSEMQRQMERAERAEADLAVKTEHAMVLWDEKEAWRKKYAELRAGVEALVQSWEPLTGGWEYGTALLALLRSGGEDRG